MAKIIDERTIHTNFQEIIDAKPSKSLDYAIPYAKAGLRMTGQELEVQALYVWASLSHWRAPEAKQIRENLKDFTSQGR